MSAKWQADNFWNWLETDRTRRSQVYGKYLFFSKWVDTLKSIAEEECKNHGFFLAKISIAPRRDEYVLCLYWLDDSRKNELRSRYEDNDEVKYRFWKSNEDTLAGKYSKTFLGD